jgi:hypothetical protein
MTERGMSSQVSGEHEVELRYFSLVENTIPLVGCLDSSSSLGGVLGLSFYRPREGQAYVRGRKRRKIKHLENPSQVSCCLPL